MLYQDFSLKIAFLRGKDVIETNAFYRVSQGVENSTSLFQYESYDVNFRPIERLKELYH